MSIKQETLGTAPTVTDKITDWRNGKQAKASHWAKQITAVSWMITRKRV